MNKELCKIAKDFGWTIDDSNEQINRTGQPSFEKNSIRIWKIKYGWRCANIIKGKYCNHRSYSSFLKAIKAETKLLLKRRNKMNEYKLIKILRKHKTFTIGIKGVGEKADLSGADLREANLYRADLSGADLRGADLRKADLYGADLSGADLRGADLRKADLYRANLYRANLHKTDLYRTNLNEANLHEANLSGANLSGADLNGANLSGANLREANLRRANLREANLRRANLNEANLHEANLSGANLSGADLNEANLSGANLREANLDLSSGISFSCKGTNIKVDDRLVSQMVYHLTRQDFSNCSDKIKAQIKEISNMEISDEFCKYRKDLLTIKDFQKEK